MPRRGRWPVYPDIFWIAGGKPKEGGIESLAGYFPAHPQGLSDRRSRARLRPHPGRQGAVSKCRARWTRRWQRAAADAAHSAAPAPVVLLSPACASYDQFKDFEQRGDVFRALVAKLPRRR